jgi:glycosyltransferase involved in cell wall biosynthesis
METDVLVVTDRAPSRHPVAGDGSSLILHDLLEHRPAHWRVTVAGPGLAPIAGTTTVDVPAANHERIGRLRRRLQGEGAPFRARAARATYRRLARRADVVYLHGPATLVLAPHLRDGPPVVVNAIDLLSALHQRDAEQVTGRRDRAVARLRSARMARLEAAATRSSAAVIVVSEREARAWAHRHGGVVTAIPNGFREAGVPWVGGASSTILFAGSLDYEPNVDSIRILVDEVLPRLRRMRPDARLHLVGRRPPPAVAALAGDQVEVLADVPDMAPHYAGAALAAFPGELGTGMRNCVSEALRHGCPVVASSHSARGVPPGPHVVLADDPAAMASAIAGLLADRASLVELAEAARRFGDSLPGPAEVAARYAEVIEGARRAGAPTRRRAQRAARSLRRTSRS